MFWRLVELGDIGNKVKEGINNAIYEVTSEVNDFIAPMGDKCIEVRYKLDQMDHYGHGCYHGTVIYIE